MPKSEDFLKTASLYEEHLKSCEYAEKTIYIRMSFTYGFLYYLESVGIDDVRRITAFTVSDYISSAHFKNRAPNGISTEIIGIRHFLRFLEDRDFIKKGIHHACFSRKNKSRRIISTYTDKKGEIRPQYFMDKNSFILLIMNYTGYNDFKRAYIHQLNNMELEISKKRGTLYAKMLRQAAYEAEQKLI